MQDLKLTPTSITYHAVLRACLRAAQWQRAVLLHADARERRRRKKRKKKTMVYG